MEQITVEKIKTKIRENLKTAVERGPDIKDVFTHRRYFSFWKRKKRIEGFLWSCGTRHARIIKRIPGLRSVAEKYYWKLSDKT